MSADGVSWFDVLGAEHSADQFIEICRGAPGLVGGGEFDRGQVVSGDFDHLAPLIELQVREGVGAAVVLTLGAEPAGTLVHAMVVDRILDGADDLGKAVSSSSA